LKTLNRETSCSFRHTLNHLSHKKKALIWGKEGRHNTATIGVLGYYWWWFLLCALSRKRCVILYGVVVAVIWYAIPIWWAILVLGFLHYLLLLRDDSWLDYFIDRIYLRKVGWVFPRVWGFPRITLCVFLYLFMLLIFSVHSIWLLM